MFRSYTLRTGLIGLIISLGFTFSFAQQTNVCQSASMIVKTAEMYHYNPRPIDDDFSKLVFSEFINLLDPAGMYFTDVEMEQLEQASHSIDEDILAQKCTFLRLAADLYNKDLHFADSLIESFNQQTFDFNLDDTILITKDVKFSNRQQLVVRWKKAIKLQVLTTCFYDHDSAETLVEPSPERFVELKNKAISNSACRVNSILNHSGGIEEYVGVRYLKAITIAFDPHTNYFTQAEQDEFTNMLSKEMFSFGFEVTRNDYGEIEIDQIIPGSPSWNSNQLNEGDIILQVKANGIEKDFNCIARDEVIQFLSSDDVKEADFLIRKKNGKELNLTLVKEKIDVEENVTTSFMLEGEQSIGYIYLPAFYSQTDGNSGLPNGCASDMARELIKLKKKEMNGLILDLRGNGGGSMLEAVLMAGIFIDYGAVGIVHTRNEEPETVKDMNKGVIYSGPLVILIDKFSASASEFFAASMQDQNRAVIVGSNSFGKSTMQQILPIDAYKYASPDKYRGQMDDFLNLTIGAFYRITGVSHQNTGVIPDVSLPDYYDEMEMGESEFKSALKLSPINKKVYAYPLAPLPIRQLAELSRSRIDNDPDFSQIREKRIVNGDKKNEFSIPLNYKSFMDFIKSTEDEDIPQDKEDAFSVKSQASVEEDAFMTDTKKQINEDIIEQIENDYYIEEAYHIAVDLINIKKQ